MVDENESEAKVVEVIDPYTVVINIGSDQDVLDGHKFLVYGISDKEIRDPDTGELLGKLPLPKGEGEATIVEPKMTIVKSIEREPPKRPGQLISIEKFAGIGYFPGEKKPFQNPQIGDKVKLLY